MRACLPLLLGALLLLPGAAGLEAARTFVGELGALALGSGLGDRCAVTMDAPSDAPGSTLRLALACAHGPCSAPCGVEDACVVDRGSLRGFLEAPCASGAFLTTHRVREDGPLLLLHIQYRGAHGFVEGLF